MSELRQTQGMNLNALDSMVLSYMLHEGLTEETSPYDYGRDIKHKCGTIKNFIIAGEIAKAEELINNICPEMLQDSRIQYLLKKQTLVEKLRNKTAEGEKDALRWIRDELAPSAETAYPAAYTDFKKLLLMFVFGEQKAESPVSYEWSAESRLYLAELIYGTLRTILGFKEPDLVNVLKYLLLHVGKSESDMIEDAVAAAASWCEKIFISQRMPAPMHLGEDNNVDVSEKDVEAIAHALDISETDAIKALRRSKGDVSAAFESEIGRLKLDMEELNSFVLEYAGYRGLLQLSESESDDNDSKDDFLDCKSDTDMMDVQEQDEGQNALSKCLSEADKPTYPVRKLKKLSYKHDPNLKTILRLLKKVRDGKYLETIEKVKGIDVELYKKYPEVLFELWRFEVLRVAGSGSYDVALDLVRKNLTPLVQHNTKLFPPLQETLTMIMSPKAEYPSTSPLCSTLQAALQESLNLPGPQLDYFVRYLLREHQTWVSTRQFQDIFSKTLGIDVLLHGGSSEILLTPPSVPVAPTTAAETESQEAERAPGESERSASMGRRSVMSDESAVEISESVINQVMEVLNFPRSHVIDLLRQHEGNAELAVLHVVQQGEDQ